MHVIIIALTNYWRLMVHIKKRTVLSTIIVLKYYKINGVI